MTLTYLGLRLTKKITARASLCAVLFALLLQKTPAVRADTDGDSLDEIGAFAIEVSGSARGNWYQVWDWTGVQVSNATSVFLLPDFSRFQFETIDTSGNGIDEVVLLAGRDSDGAVVLQVRNPAGANVAGRFLPGAGFRGHQLFQIELDGAGPEEIGVGFTREADNVGFVQIYRRNVVTGSLVQLVSATVSGPGLGNRTWGAADFDGDGNQELYVGFTRTSDGAGGFITYDPQVLSVLGSAFVSGSGFENFQFLVGDFVPGTAGEEVAVGYVRSGDGAALYQVRDENGINLGGRFITAAGFTEYLWRKVSNGTSEQLFVGFVRNSDGVPAFQVWNPVNGAQVSSRFIIGSGFAVQEWLTGNFDANAANGDEIVVGFTRLSDRAVGFQHWNRQASAQLGAAFVLGSGFVAPNFVAAAAASAGRTDVVVSAKKVDGAPLVKLWTAAGSQIFARFIFNNDVF